MVKRSLLVGTAALAAGATLVTTAAASGSHDSPRSGSSLRTYQIIVHNNTEGQPLSPPVLVTHSKRVDLWSVGTIASHPVAAIAEDADNAPLISVAAHIRGIREAQTAVTAGASGPAPIGPMASQTYRLTTDSSHTRLTLLSMLVNSNDAFTGLDATRLPDHIGQTRTFTKMAYDAGSEVNNEKAAFIPGPIGGHRFVRDPEGNVIRMHPGIVGGADLSPTLHSVNGTVATITITRVT